MIIYWGPYTAGVISGLALMYRKPWLILIAIVATVFLSWERE